MGITFESWLKEVEGALASINMSLADWQSHWTFDFSREFSGGTSANDAAKRANQFWWHQQNKAIGQDCQKTVNCWLPRNHQDDCQPQECDSLLSRSRSPIVSFLERELRGAAP